MIEFTDKGMYCAQADVYIDPIKPVNKALITHGHSDHARWGSQYYLCHHDTLPVLKLRLGQEINVQGIAYGETIMINQVSVTFFPSGHIIGAAQIRLIFKGEIWVISGDYKLYRDGLSIPYESVKCHNFITESTFGLPIYKFPKIYNVYDDINQWCRKNAENGFNSILLAYSLGKSQNILSHLEEMSDVYLHGAVANINDALALNGYYFKGRRIEDTSNKKTYKGGVIIAPPSAHSSPWIKRFKPYKIASCSGWMQLRGARRRSGVDRGFVLSDHADWDQLNEAVQSTGAENIFVTHGYENIYAKWLNEKWGLNAIAVKSLYENIKEDED